MPPLAGLSRCFARHFLHAGTSRGGPVVPLHSRHLSTPLRRGLSPQAPARRRRSVRGHPAAAPPPTTPPTTRAEDRRDVGMAREAVAWVPVLVDDGRAGPARVDFVA